MMITLLQIAQMVLGVAINAISLYMISKLKLLFAYNLTHGLKNVNTVVFFCRIWTIL